MSENTEQTKTEVENKQIETKEVKVFPEDYVKALREEAKANRLKYESYEKEIESLKSKLSEYEGQIEQTKKQVRLANLKSHLIKDVVDVDAALELADKPEFFSENQEFQIDKFKEKYKFLFKEEKPSVNNKVQTGSYPKTVTADDLRGKSVEEINRIINEMKKK
ncbi:MAG: hypothetical protein QXT97_02570 [Candidatus Diapherotrites archaeon]